MLNILSLLLPVLLSPQSGPEIYQKLEDTFAKAKTAKVRFKLEAKEAGAEKSEGGFDGMILFKEGRLVSMTGTTRLGDRESGFSFLIADGKLQGRVDGGRDRSAGVPKDYAAAFQKTFLRGGFLMAFGLTSPDNPTQPVLDPLKAFELAEMAPGADGKSLTYKLVVKEEGVLQYYGPTLACTLKYDPADHTITSRQIVGKKQQAAITFTEHYVVTLDADLPDKLFRLLEPDELKKKKPPKRGGWKPTECMSNQCTVDPTDAKVGRWMTYRSEAGVAKTDMTTRIVDKAGEDLWVESWMDAGTMKYGFLFQVGPDKVIKKAWAAADGDPAWTSITVKEPPKGAGAGGGPAPTVKTSEEKKEVKAGSFDCTRLDVSVTVGGKEYKSSTWYSKSVWKLQNGTEHGGMLAMEGTGVKFFLEGLGEDAKPTLPLPKE